MGNTHKKSYKYNNINDTYNKSNNNNEYTFKIFVTGSNYVGKTSFVNILKNNEYDDIYNKTYNCNKFIYSKFINNTKHIYEIYDTGHFEISYDTLPYFDMLLILFDGTNKESYNYAKKIVKKYKNESIIKYLICNKCDKDININKEHLFNFLEKYNDYNYMEISAKTYYNIDLLIKYIDIELFNKIKD